jgi:asparagine synthetase B (glutamine-hydrolysing)
VDATRSLVETSVHARLVDDERYGTHLSGGIDSSSVAVIAARRLRESRRDCITGYSWSPPAGPEFPLQAEHDEREFITDLSEREGIPVIYGNATGEDFRSFLYREFELEGATVTMEFRFFYLAGVGMRDSLLSVT